MPQKVEGEKHDKVVSTKLTRSQYEALKILAKELYLSNVLAQPNMSQLLEYLIIKWLRAKDKVLAGKKSSNGSTTRPPEAL